MAADNNRYGESRRHRGRRSLLVPLGILLVVVIVIFAISVFFRVHEIEVVGAVSYTEEEIIRQANIDEGENIFFVNTAASSSRIFSSLPRVDSAKIEKIYAQGKIIITVEESKELAYVQTDGQYWRISGSCKLIDSVLPSEVAGLIHVVNITPVEPVAGAMMEVSPDESLKLSYLQDILSILQKAGITGDVTEIDMENAADPSFRYLDRFTVKLGSNENLEYKLRMLLSAVPQIEEDLTGTIDLAASNSGTEVHVILE